MKFDQTLPFHFAGNSDNRGARRGKLEIERYMGTNELYESYAMNARDKDTSYVFRLETARFVYLGHDALENIQRVDFDGRSFCSVISLLNNARKFFKYVMKLNEVTAKGKQKGNKSSIK